MKRLNLILFGILFCVQMSYSQSFIEVCPSNTMDGTMVHCVTFNDTVYGTGFFTEICGSITNYVAKWDGSMWQPTNIPLSNAGHTLKEINNQLFIGTYVEVVDSNWLYEFDGANLNKWGDGVYLTTATPGFSELASIYDVVEFNGQIYVCGEFDRVGNQSISGIMRWNGSSWEDVGGGLSGNISGTSSIMYPHQMVVHDNSLYVVGNFGFAGGVEVNGVARWDGTTWSALGDGFNSTVYGVGVYDNEVWVGGGFTMSGQLALNRIAKWNGTDWESPGFGFVDQVPYYTFVHTFLEADGGFYIAGGIKRIEMDIGTTIDCGGIIHFSPSGINTFNGGVQGNDIEAIGKTQTNQLVIGGGVFGDGYTGILDQVSGQNELVSSPSIQVYPNPAKNIIKIESKSPISSVLVTTLNGEVVLSKNSVAELNISSLSAGVYFVQVNAQSGFQVIKLVK